MDGLFALLVFSFVSSVTPGPNNVLLWASGAAFGFRRTLRHVFGTALGIGLIAIGVAAGLGVLVGAIPALEFGMKVAGSLYLLYLAVQVARAREVARGQVARPLGLRGGAAFQALNPKSWVFALGAMTTFRPASLPAVTGGALVAVVMAIVVIPTAAFWAAGGDVIGRFLTDGRSRRVVNLVFAALLAGTVALIWL